MRRFTTQTNRLGNRIGRFMACPARAMSQIGMTEVFPVPVGKLTRGGIWSRIRRPNSSSCQGKCPSCPVMAVNASSKNPVSFGIFKRDVVIIRCATSYITPHGAEQWAKGLALSKFRLRHAPTWGVFTFCCRGAATALAPGGASRRIRFEAPPLESRSIPVPRTRITMGYSRNSKLLFYA